MKFLKDPVLITALIVVVVAAPVLGLLIHRSSSSRKRMTDERVKLSDDLSRLGRGNYVRPLLVEKAEGVVELRKTQAERVEDGFVQYNRRNYKIATFKVGDEEVPAFPFDEKRYRGVLGFEFARAYQRETQALLAMLNPTRPPTDQEIADAIALRQQQEGLDSETPASATPWASGVDERLREGGDMIDMLRRGRRGGTSRIDMTRRPPAEGKEEETLETQVTREQIYDRAMAGSIYADERSLSMIVSSTTRRYNADELWMAWVNLWIERDIVEAIRLTNEQGSEKEGVPTAAVKRLIGSRLRGYAVRAGAVPMALSGAGGRPVSPTGAGVAGAGAGAGAAPLNLLYVPERVGTLDVTDQYLRKGGSAVPALTQRYCNPRYDVVHYEFTVVISPRQLLRLYKNLMDQNYHTVIDVHISKADALEQSSSGRPVLMAKDSTAGRYYYGTEMVVRARIVGELLLLTEWARGPADPETRKRAPATALMPDKLLRKIAILDPDALRPEDKDALAPEEGAAGIGSRGRGGMGTADRDF